MGGSTTTGDLEGLIFHILGWRYTIWEFTKVPQKNGPFQKGKSSSKHHFAGNNVTFGGVNPFQSTHHLATPCRSQGLDYGRPWSFGHGSGGSCTTGLVRFGVNEKTCQTIFVILLGNEKTYNNCLVWNLESHFFIQNGGWFRWVFCCVGFSFLFWKTHESHDTDLLMHHQQKKISWSHKQSWRKGRKI